ncbi:MAG: hypothetical protein HQL31_14310, partial [Planctomycetes bacterium]|nr:hypothetical protein [Planctomycetota bacterium]
MHTDLQLDLGPSGLKCSALGLSLVGGLPQVMTDSDGAGGIRIFAPSAPPTISRDQIDTPLGRAEREIWYWSEDGGLALTWRIGVLRSGAGLILEA